MKLFNRKTAKPSIKAVRELTLSEAALVSGAGEPGVPQEPPATGHTNHGGSGGHCKSM